MRNPAKLLQLKKQYEAFTARHPKFMRYLAYITDNYMSEGTVMDVTVTDTTGKSLQVGIVSLQLSAQRCQVFQQDALHQRE